MIKKIYSRIRNTMDEIRRSMIVYSRFLSSYRKNTPPRVSSVLNGGIGLYYWDETDNLGDYLSYVVCDHMSRNLSSSEAPSSGKVLYAIGSILGFIRQDAVVWGSGILSADWAYRLYAKHSNLDIRAVRGPNTAKVLRSIGKNVPEIYGDPAILMPDIYQPAPMQKQYPISFIPHFSDKTPIPSGVHRIEIQTRDYQHVIDQIASSQLVISSSLHGVILAETYGVPAVLLLHEYQNCFKYEDWYLSTGRSCVYAHTIEEAMHMQPPCLPDLTQMQQKLIAAFPQDMWQHS